MSSLLAILFRLVLLAGFTFAFVVLYEHGPKDFSANAKVEWSALKVWWSGEKEPEPVPATSPTPEPELPTPEPTPVPMPTPMFTPTPVPSVAPTPKPFGAWEALQKQPIGEGMDIPIAGKAGDPPPKSKVNQ